jgi:hypothetical protein
VRPCCVRAARAWGRRSLQAIEFCGRRRAKSNLSSACAARLPPNFRAF